MFKKEGKFRRIKGQGPKVTDRLQMFLFNDLLLVAEKVHSIHTTPPSPLSEPRQLTYALCAVCRVVGRVVDRVVCHVPCVVCVVLFMKSFGHIRSYKWKVNIPMKGLWLQDIPDNSLPGGPPSHTTTHPLPHTYQLTRPLTLWLLFYHTRPAQDVQKSVLHRGPQEGLDLLPQEGHPPGTLTSATHAGLRFLCRHTHALDWQEKSNWMRDLQQCIDDYIAKHPEAQGWPPPAR